MENIFKFNPKLKTLRQILQEIEPGTYSLNEIHKISGWKYKQSVYRALKTLPYKKSYKKNPINHSIEAYYEIKKD